MQPAIAVERETESDTVTFEQMSNNTTGNIIKGELYILDVTEQTITYVYNSLACSETGRAARKVVLNSLDGSKTPCLQLLQRSRDDSFRPMNCFYLPVNPQDTLIQIVQHPIKQD